MPAAGERKNGYRTGRHHGRARPVGPVSERQGRHLAFQFEAIRSVFEQTLGVRVVSGKPFIVMGFKNKKSMRAIMPEYWEKKGQIHPDGGLLPGPDKIYAFIRLDAGGGNPFGIVYHEYAHMVLNLHFRSMPLWMSEGLAEFYGFSTIGEQEFRLGEPAANCILALRRRKMLPLAELFRVTYDSPDYNEDAKAQIFYAESWALTHYLMLAERTEAGQPNRLSRFLSLLGQGVDQDEATRLVFDDPAKLQADLEVYIGRSAFDFLSTKTDMSGSSEDFSARALSPAEAAARLGDFQLQNGRRTASLFSIISL